MIEQFFTDPAALGRLRRGPLTYYIDTFAALLLEQGYTKAGGKPKIRLVADLSRWLDQRHLQVSDLDEQTVSKFLQYKRRYGRVHRGYAATLQQLLQYLRKDGLIPAPTAKVDDTLLHRIESEFRQYLIQERGLSQATVVNYLPVVHRFLSECFGKGEIRLAELHSSDITRFILRNAQTVSRSIHSLTLR